MKPLRFIFLVSFVTAAIFLYTHQGIDAVTLSYRIKEKGVKVDKLLDQRKELEYNVAKLKSPTHLELQLAKADVRLVLPKRWRVFEVTEPEEEKIHFWLPLLVRNIVGHIFLNREAQATPATK